MDWKADFIAWHESRLAECGYTPEIVTELRHTRSRWLSGVR